MPPKKRPQIEEARRRRRATFTEEDNFELKRAYIQQRKVGIFDNALCGGDSSLGDVRYLATSGVCPCVAFTIHADDGSIRKTLLAHFDDDGTEQMRDNVRSYIAAFRDHIPSGEHTIATIVQSSSSGRPLLDAIVTAVNEMYGASGSTIRSIDELFGELYGAEDICIDLITGAIKRYVEQQPEVLESHLRSELNIPRIIEVYSLHDGRLELTSFEDDVTRVATFPVDRTHEASSVGRSERDEHNM